MSFSSADKSESLVQTQQRFQRALELALHDLQADEQVLAVLLEGSLSHDSVWFRSDIDMLVIVKDQKLSEASRTLLYENVLFSIGLMQRSDFIRISSQRLTGSIHHSTFSNGSLVFLRDENLRSYFDDLDKLGKYDRDIVYLLRGALALYSLDKAEKWLSVKRDPVYAFHWLCEVFYYIACLEVLRHGKIPLRESIHQAESFNPDFFQRHYRQLSDVVKTEANISTAIAACRAYMQEHAATFFALVIDYLREEDDVRSFSEMLRFLQKKNKDIDQFVLEHCLPFLCEIGLIESATICSRMTPKSRKLVEEAAYLISS